MVFLICTSFYILGLNHWPTLTIALWVPEHILRTVGLWTTVKVENHYWSHPFVLTCSQCREIVTFWRITSVQKIIEYRLVTRIHSWKTKSNTFWDFHARIPRNSLRTMVWKPHRECHCIWNVLNVYVCYTYARITEGMDTEVNLTLFCLTHALVHEPKDLMCRWPCTVIQCG